MQGHGSTMALASFAAAIDPATLPGEVRQKLGWLLLDHLRVCSIGARLPWSDWSRRYVSLVGHVGPSHVLFSAETLNPQHATFLNVTFGSSFDADDTHVGAMLPPGVATWSAALAMAEARRPLQVAASAAQAGLQEEQAGNTIAAKRDFAVATASFSAAQHRLATPGVAAGRIVPVVAVNLRAATTLAGPVTKW